MGRRAGGRYCYRYVHQPQIKGGRERESRTPLLDSATLHGRQLCLQKMKHNQYPKEKK